MQPVAAGTDPPARHKGRDLKVRGPPSESAGQFFFSVSRKEKDCRVCTHTHTHTHFSLKRSKIRHVVAHSGSESMRFLILISRWSYSWCIRTPDREDSCPYSLQVAKVIRQIKAQFKIQGIEHVQAVNSLNGLEKWHVAEHWR